MSRIAKIVVNYSNKTGSTQYQNKHQNCGVISKVVTFLGWILEKSVQRVLSLTGRFTLLRVKYIYRRCEERHLLFGIFYIMQTKGLKKYWDPTIFLHVQNSEPKSLFL